MPEILWSFLADCVMNCDLLYSTHNMLINHGVVCKTFGLSRTAEVGSREGMKGKAGNKDDSIKQFREQNSECIVTMDSKVTTMPGESACFLSLFFSRLQPHLCKAKRKL